LYGANPKNSDLLNWASDEAKRLSIWKIIDQNVTGFPDSSVEWCALNLRDETGARGIVVAFNYTANTPQVRYRQYFNKEWKSGWMTII
jgi:hypothetical protein